MAKDKITDYSATASSNTDVGGINIAEGCPGANMNNAVREMMAHLAELNDGTNPIADTFSIADPADLTKKARLDAGNVTPGTERVLSVPDASTTLVGTDTTQTLTNKTISGGTVSAVLTAEDATDATKKLANDISGFTTATTRTVTWPDQDVTISTFGASLIDDANASAARTTLGLATVASTGDYNDLTNTPATSGLGVGQTWQDVTASRAQGTTYHNTTGNPISVGIDLSGGTGATGDFQVSTNGSTWVSLAANVYFATSGSASRKLVSQGPFVVPDNHYYRVSGSGFTINAWVELR